MPQMPEETRDPVSDAAADRIAADWEAEDAPYDAMWGDGAQSSAAPAASEGAAADRIGAQWDAIDAPYNHDRWNLQNQQQQQQASAEASTDDAAFEQYQERLHAAEHERATQAAEYHQRSLDEAHLAHAMELFDDGTVEPAAIANELRSLAPNVAGRFVEAWHAFDEGFASVEDYRADKALPDTAAEWTQRALAQQEGAWVMERLQEREAQQEAQASYLRELEHVLGSALEHARQSRKGFAGREHLVHEVLRQTTVHAPEQIPLAVEMADNIALEAQRARAIAEMKADMDDPHSRGWMTTSDAPYDREAEIQKHIAQHEIDERRLLPAADLRAQRQAGIVTSLDPDARERAIADGWSIDAFDVNAARAKQTLQRKGLA
jgi:hypothetical protein